VRCNWALRTPNRKPPPVLFSSPWVRFGCSKQETKIDHYTLQAYRLFTSRNVCSVNSITSWVGLCVTQRQVGTEPLPASSRTRLTTANRLIVPLQLKLRYAYFPACSLNGEKSTLLDPFSKLLKLWRWQPSGI
jgi:hypothetical protein